MRNKIRRVSIRVIVPIAVVMVIASALYSTIGVTYEVGSQGSFIPVADLSAIPQSVAEDATELATEIFGNCQEKCNDFMNQMLAIYSEAKEKDFVIVFNSGGWGSKMIEHYLSGWSILNGIEAELDSLGYLSLSLVHLRTDGSWLGCLDEITERISGYPAKAKDLASRIEFLTNHIPDLKVIITADSGGIAICDKVMTILENNPQVYTIQTGPPPWHGNTASNRTLVMASNGIIPDSFSQGNLWAMFWGNLGYWFGLSQPIDDFGTPSHYVGAPGHDYWWQYPEVCSEISDFLDENFGLK